MERQSTTALIGREAELARLASALADDRWLVILGEAGIGKTSLVRAAVRLAGRPVYEGGGFATLAWSPYLALRRAVGRPLDGEAPGVAASVESVVGPGVLFIDDLQWVDAASRGVLELLAGRVAIVTVVREGDQDADAALALCGRAGAQVTRLAGLAGDDARQVVLQARPGLGDDAIERTLRLAAGNPFLLGEIARSGRPDEVFGRTLQDRRRRLSPQAQAALDLLAVAGRPLAANAVPGMDDVEQAGLAVRVGDLVDIRHALLAEAIRGDLDPGARVAAHAAAAALVEDQAERARHLLAAGDRDAAHAVAHAALETTADPRTRAILLATAAQSSGEESSGMRVTAAGQLLAIGDTAGAIALLADPIDDDDDAKAGAAAVLAGALDHEGRHDEAWAVIESTRGLRPAGDSIGAIELAATEGTVLVNNGRLADAVAAIERARAAAGPAAGGYRLAGHEAALRLYAGETDQLSALEDAVAAAFATGDGGNAANRAMDLYYMILSWRGGAAALAFAGDASGRLDDLGYRTRADELRAESAQASIYAGELRATVVMVDSMLEAPLGLLSRQRLAYNRGLALGLLGHVEDAERTLADVASIATDDFDGRGATLWCWAEASLWAGQPGRAREQASAALTYGAFNDSEFVLPSLARAWAELESGERPTPGPIDTPFRLMAGAPPEFRGLSALAQGSTADAAAAFDAAAALWAGFHVPRELLCRWAAGEALRRDGDRGTAVERLHAVLTDASAIGFEPLAARARRSLRLAGERPAAAPASPRTSGLLTGREREILTLVERGLTNAEIARRMSLGRPTVARLLSNAMLKLGADSRAQAVILAADAT